MPNLEEHMNREFSSIIEALNVHDVHVTKYVSHLKNSYFENKHGHEDDKIGNLSGNDTKNDDPSHWLGNMHASVA